ncbi:MAG: response regulator [Rubrivivax sp.]|nr:response regulator [Rubrivivax sp.]
MSEVRAPADALREALHQAWAAQVRDPAQALLRGRALVAESPAGSLAAGHGHFHEAWAELRWGSMARACEAMARLADCAAGHADAPDLLAAWRDVQAALLRREHRHAEALALLETNLGLPESARMPQAHWVSTNGAAITCGALHRMDDALRHFHRAIAWAEASQDEALLATATGNLGGAHYDVYNLEDALHWTRLSHEQALRSGAAAARAVAAINLILILCERRCHQDAVPWVQAVQADPAGVRADKRGKYATIFAEVARGCGDLARAQALLDEAATLRAAGEAPSQEWVSVQADVLLAQGEALRARELVETQLATQPTANVHDLPMNALRLREIAAQACERLQDWQAALAHHRSGMALHESLIGRSARAARVALEVRHELDSARRQRDAARAEQQRLAQLNAALAATNRARTDFLAAASHDLRQPVHALALQVAALRGELQTERQHRMADRVERCVAALSGLFDGLLDLSRLDAGVVQPQWETLALPPLLAGLAEEIEPQAAAKGLRLALRLPLSSELPATFTDALLLQRLLRNLLVNALRYTERGAVLLALRRQDGAWCIQVRDSGIGIAEDLQPRVFDEFVQGHNPARQRDQGLGLGLAIVARLARVLDHTVSLRSAPGRGTTVSVRVPMARAPRALPIGSRAIPSPLALRVAVIDDDRETRAALQDLLALWGCEARADDQAHRLLQEAGWRADVAIVDYRLPDGRDGLGEVHALRAAWGPDLPCLIVTGETGPALLQTLQQAGQPWMAKPLSAPALRQWLQAQAATKA